MTQEWLEEFKAKFRKITGITWNEDAGNSDADAERWYHGNEEDTRKAVFEYIEKYDLTTI